MFSLKIIMPISRTVLLIIFPGKHAIWVIKYGLIEMDKIALSEYVKEYGQVKAARLLGVHQTAISKALMSERHIFLFRQQDGSYTAEEWRPFPSKKQNT
jgi:hypothetical protein